jgi:hypothetical protein
MNTDIVFVLAAGLAWLGCMWMAYTAGFCNGFDDGRDLRDSQEIEDLIEEENRHE